MSFWKKSAVTGVVRVGGQSVEQLIAANQAVERETSVCAKDVMKQTAFTVSVEKRDVAVVQMPLCEYFSESPTTAEIFAKAESLQYTKRPAEVAPNLAAQYAAEQPKGEWLVVGHDAIVDSDGIPFLLRVGRDGGGLLWLDADSARPDDRWSLGHVFLFGPPAS